MGTQNASEIIAKWPDESREAAQLVIDTYGDPHEATESLLVWHRTGPWKRIIAAKEFYEHTHLSGAALRLGRDGSRLSGSHQVLHATSRLRRQRHRRADGRRGLGALSRRAGEQPGAEPDARHRHGREVGRGGAGHYAKEFLDARRKKPTPYMDELTFEPGTDTADSDERVLSDEQLEQAVAEGEKRAEPARA